VVRSGLVRAGRLWFAQAGSCVSSGSREGSASRRAWFSRGLGSHRLVREGAWVRSGLVRPGAGLGVLPRLCFAPGTVLAQGCGQLGAPVPAGAVDNPAHSSRRAVDNPALPSPRSATLPHRGPEPGAGSLEDARLRSWVAGGRPNPAPVADEPDPRNRVAEENYEPGTGSLTDAPTLGTGSLKELARATRRRWPGRTRPRR
jgi:hypothetical protein